MLSMRNAVNAAEAEQAIKTAIFGLMNESAVDHISVSPGDDTADEPSLFVTVYLRGDRPQPSAAESIDLVRTMRDALFDLGDDRFPHLSFSAPGDEPSEDIRPAE
jgi:hypothetical protein